MRNMFIWVWILTLLDLTQGDPEPPTDDARWQHITREVTDSHANYDLLECARSGLQHSLLDSSGLQKRDIDDSDYGEREDRHIQHDNKTCVFTTFAPKVFAAIRHSLGMDDSELMESVSPPHSHYLEFLSNSKGGQSFFLSPNKIYFIKTETQEAMHFLLDILSDYVRHFQHFPHSLLVKYLGVYSLVMQDGEPVYIYVMQSIFHPDDNIQKRYDIKGSLRNRYQEPVKSTSTIQVFKDENFLTETLDVGTQRDWLLRQLHYDVTLLLSFHVTDYSMLIGCHSRTSGRGSNNVNTARTHETHELQTSTFSFLKEPTLSELSSQNKRNILGSRESLHIIDGPRDRYYLGIIDFIGNGSSGLSPDMYADRFIDFVSQHIR